MDDYRRAGKLAKQALLYGAALIKVGASMRDVLDKTEAYIRSHGLEPAFPAQSCVNQMAAHFCPTEQEDYIYQKGDLVKFDVGVECNGFIGDNAMTISLDSGHEKLLLTVKKALDEVEKMLKPGLSMHQIGETVQKILHKEGFEPVRNLTGHGLEQYTQHASPSVPNYPNNDHTKLVEGMVIAVEPFGTTGKGMIYSAANPTVFSLAKSGPVRTEMGRAVLKVIERYNGLPFTTRWLTQKLGSKAVLGLHELRRLGMLHEYAPLPEKSGGVVAQWENTFLITATGCEVLTRA